MNDVTRILQSIDSGDPKAAEELLPLVCEELRRLAAAKMAKEAPGQTLQATALVLKQARIDWRSLGGEKKCENFCTIFRSASLNPVNRSQINAALRSRVVETFLNPFFVLGEDTSSVLIACFLAHGRGYWIRTSRWSLSQVAKKSANQRL